MSNSDWGGDTEDFEEDAYRERAAMGGGRVQVGAIYATTEATKRPHEKDKTNVGILHKKTDASSTALCIIP